MTLVPDEDGHLYDADFREHAQGALEPDLLATFEAGVTLVHSGQMVGEAVTGIRSEPVRPPAHRYAWLFAGLDDRQLTTTRDACWRILGS